MRWKAVIFDLDGTLVGTDSECRKIIVGKTLRELGIASYDSTHVDRFWFGAKREEIIRECFGVEAELFWKAYRPHDTIDLRKKFTNPYKDIDFIQELRRKGIKVGIVTGAPPHVAEHEISLIGEGNFDSIVIASALGGKKPKPHPEGILECLAELGVSKEDAVYIGNAEEDVITADNAGIPCIIVDRKEHKLEFKEAKPLCVISSLYELR